MAKVTIVDRKGKDLFDFLRAVELDPKSAKNWALETFVKLDDEFLTMEKIAKLKNDSYIIITEKVFSLNLEGVVEEDNVGVHFKNITIKKKLIHRDLITDIQATQAKVASSGNKIGLIKNFIVRFFDVTHDQLEELPYEVVGYMFRYCNDFLSKVTKHANEFDIDDDFTLDSGGNDPGIVGNVV